MTRVAFHFTGKKNGLLNKLFWLSIWKKTIWTNILHYIPKQILYALKA